MTADQLDAQAAFNARRTYDRAVERHFAKAIRLAPVRPETAKGIAQAAVALRMDARYELEVR